MWPLLVFKSLGYRIQYQRETERERERENKQLKEEREREREGEGGSFLSPFRPKMGYSRGPGTEKLQP